ncbi:MAG: Kiwa anti-phage protein KwaB-like domain-containing protein [Candidatus Rokuibacteriota bacterium]
MTLAFNLRNVRVTEFGVGRDDEEGQTFHLVPVDADVQAALQEMVAATWSAMRELSDDPPRYEPSEKHASSEYVYLPIGDDLAEPLRQLHEANNLAVDSAALSDHAKVFCYFVRMTDKQGRRLTAIRRATQFKGILKSRLIRLVTDALRIIEDRVFKLDSDFDILIDNARVHILRPSGFEFVGKLQAAVLAGAPENVKAIQRDLPFVDFDLVENYAAKHPRAARYLASIRAQKATTDIDKRALKELCKATGVEIQEAKGKITVADGHVMGFLEVLDRRRYEVELVKGSPERFRAASRRKLEGSGQS